MQRRLSLSALRGTLSLNPSKPTCCCPPPLRQVGGTSFKLSMATRDFDYSFFCELGSLGLIAISGSDAGSFLHGQVTCDIHALAPEASCYGGYCSPKGRLLATFLVWRSANGYLLQLPRPLCESVQQRLSKFILRARVLVNDESDRFARFGVGGSKVLEVVEKNLGPLPAAEHGVRHAPEATLLALPGGRIEIVVPAEKSLKLRDALRSAANESNPSVWELMDIRAGIPNILPATQDRFVPQMVNLDRIGGISFSKGCYPGQEIVARMHYLGRLKSRAYLAHLDGPNEPQPGDPLYSDHYGDQACGTVVNAAPTPTGGYDVLAVFQIGSANAGRVRWRKADGPALKIQALPYSI